jgi:hypothetical protein
VYSCFSTTVRWRATTRWCLSFIGSTRVHSFRCSRTGPRLCSCRAPFSLSPLRPFSLHPILLLDCRFFFILTSNLFLVLILVGAFSHSVRASSADRAVSFPAITDRALFRSRFILKSCSRSYAAPTPSRDFTCTLPLRSCENAFVSLRWCPSLARVQPPGPCANAASQCLIATYSTF